MGVHGCAQVYAGMRRCMQVCARVFTGVHGCAWVCVGVPGHARLCVWDEFSEYLLELETRFLTSANYNMHPLRIFFIYDVVF